MSGIIARVQKIIDELHAQKIAHPLNFGALTIPDDAPTETWSGYIHNDDGDENYNAKFIAKFTRTDGVLAPPLVDFPWSITLGKGIFQDQIDAGYIDSASGRDLNASDQYGILEHLSEIGSNFIAWEIDIKLNYYSSSDGTTVDLTVQAISVVNGILELEKIL